MGKIILIIEDDELVVQLLQKKLVKEGYQVFIARDGEEGLREIRRLKPDIILLDIIMPKLDGFSVMEEIQKDQELKKIPIIIVSNSGQPVELNRAQKLGARDWLIKAEFDPQEVLIKIKKQIG
ncbi:MAG: response regulator [bacterium]|nr:response regulator [bacterium]